MNPDRRPARSAPDPRPAPPAVLSIDEAAIVARTALHPEWVHATPSPLASLTRQAPPAPAGDAEGEQR
ncbi:hypothetical protein [Streptomyces sp. NPDC051572]|uniref:hypothetical protein n=1 Tax=Streptomyces sp. NPDC051572 TaxID=3155802 RepID=UPI003450554F